MENNKMYIVKYYGGSYDDYYTVNIFVTAQKSTATKYVTKFNRILKKWKLYYSLFENRDNGFAWIDDKYSDKYIRRNMLRNATKCYYEEIDVR